jgi:hypothetical protein
MVAAFCFLCGFGVMGGMHSHSHGIYPVSSKRYGN